MQNIQQTAELFLMAIMERDVDLLTATMRRQYEMQSSMHFDDPENCEPATCANAKKEVINMLQGYLDLAKQVL